MPRPVRGQDQLNRLGPAGEPVQGEEGAAREEKGQGCQVGDHHAVEPSGHRAHEEAQRSGGYGGQYDERQAYQDLECAHGQRPSEDGSDEHGPLDDDGHRDGGYRLADRPHQGTVRQDPHPQQGAADPIGVHLPGDLQDDEAAECADAAGDQHGAECCARIAGVAAEHSNHDDWEDRDQQ